MSLAMPVLAVLSLAPSLLCAAQIGFIVAVAAVATAFTAAVTWFVWSMIDTADLRALLAHAFIVDGVLGPSDVTVLGRVCILI